MENDTFLASDQFSDEPPHLFDTYTLIIRLITIRASMAALLKKQGQCVRAYELAIFVNRHPMTEWWVHEDLRPLLAELEAALPPEVAAEAEARAKRWTLDDVLAEVLIEAGRGSDV